MTLAIALSGLGSHPAAAAIGERPLTLADAAHWTGLLASLDRDEIAFATIADGPDATAAVGAEPRLPWLDAAMIACRLAPCTARVGLIAQIPTVTTDPFIVSTQLATLDHVSGGRAGWEPQVGLDAAQAGRVGPREVPPPQQRFAEAAEHIEVVRRLWDSWDDDAEIRDVSTNRFVDRERLHHIRYEGRYLSVMGPSITPRPPQGQPLVALASGGDARTTLAATQADIVFVDATRERLAGEVQRVTATASRAGRDPRSLRIFADLPVVVDRDHGLARERLARLEEIVADGWSLPGAAAFAGTPAALAELLTELAAEGADGVRLHPAVLGDDLPPIVSALTGELASGDGAVPAHRTLRERLGLPRPANRYADVA